MSIIGSNILAGSSGQGGAYEIEQSLRFNSADSAYLNRTSAAGNRRTFTASAWVKKAALAQSGFQALVTWTDSGGTKDEYFGFQISNASDTVWIFSRTGGTDYYISTSAVLRDPSAWYHLVFVVDTTQATATDRFKIYINGELATIATSAYPPQNHDLPYVNVSGKVGYIGAWYDNPWYYLNGYLAEVNFIDGSALDPTDFGEFDDNGVWRPIKYAGSYTGNSFYLKFDAADVDGDSSGLSNDWTANNISTTGTGTDVMSDTPTTNYATLNAIDPVNVIFTEGNLKGQFNNDYETARSTIAMTAGKWYWEVVGSTPTGSLFAGVVNKNANLKGYVGQDANGWAFVDGTGNLHHNASNTAYGSAVSDGTVMGFAFDADTGKMWVRNASGYFASGNPVAGTNPAMTAGAGEYYPACGEYYSNGSFTINFGQRAFAYTPPTGFNALNTANLPAPDIADGSDYFNTVLYTGDGASSRSITGVGFQPDFVWLKRRSGAGDHSQYDAVRGATKLLQSSQTNAEQTLTNSLTSFDTDGFGVGTYENASSITYVGWNWLAGGSVSADNNTDGSIPSTVSANPTAGFSIVSYTGTGTAGTVGHGLGVPPSFYVVKNRDGAYFWPCYHASLTNPATTYIGLNETTAQQTGETHWNSTAPISTVFSVNTQLSVNNSGDDYIAYCFAEVEGYSKFGSYTGNGSTDGPFVWCGLRPKLILMKSSTNSATPWQIFDSVREPENTVEQTLIANGPSSEPYDTASPVDFLSNGFKLRGGASSYNNYNTGTWIFAAFAENPFGGSGVSPACAR